MKCIYNVRNVSNACNIFAENLDPVLAVGFEDPSIVPVDAARPRRVKPGPQPPRRLRQAGDPDHHDSDDDGTMPVVEGGAGNRAMHLNEEAAPEEEDYGGDDEEEQDDDELEMLIQEGADDLLERYLGEEEAQSGKKKSKRKVRKVPVADNIDISLFYNLPLAEAGRRLKWVSRESQDYDEAFWEARVFPPSSWRWCNEAVRASRLTWPPSGPPTEKPPPPPEASSPVKLPSPEKRLTESEFRTRVLSPLRGPLSRWGSLLAEPVGPACWQKPGSKTEKY